jgi:hypothetical protein
VNPQNPVLWRISLFLIALLLCAMAMPRLQAGETAGVETYAYVSLSSTSTGTSPDTARA